MTAALSASSCGIPVTLIEHKDRVGKKILSTGNGKCNFTNQFQGKRDYYGSSPDFVVPALTFMGLEQTLSFFRELGVLSVCRDGYYYPRTLQAQTVLDALRFALDRQGVHVICDTSVSGISGLEGDFHLLLKGRDGKTIQRTFGRIIFATGGLAFPSSGSDGSADPLVRSLGHHITKRYPALTALNTKEKLSPSWKGVRADGKVSLLCNSKVLQQEEGQVQLTDYGVSGIPVFQMSRNAAKLLGEGKEVSISLDVLPELTEEGLAKELGRRSLRKNESLEKALCGLIHKKVLFVLLKKAGLSPEKAAGTVPEDGWGRLAFLMKHYSAKVTGTQPFSKAQVTAGGIELSEVDPATMESRIKKGIYFAGEMLDIDGRCGGYNLQWAWSSGALAGKSAGGSSTC